ncbi:MAG: DsrE/DsrF/TusD sulfur relay family protein [Vulcanimicrobiota bacterium]
MAKFAFVLNKSPFVGEYIETLYGLACAALKKGHKVFIYLNNDAVYGSIKNQIGLNGEKTPKEMLNELTQHGAEVMCSRIHMQARGFNTSKTFLEGLKTGGLSDLSEILSDYDKVVSL